MVEALSYLTEECGEVLQAAGKIGRFGWQQPNPDLPVDRQVPNHRLLRNELQDLKQAIEIMEIYLNKAGYTT